jgi:hypothetical protein
MDQESLFAYKLRDLRDRVKSRNEYDLLQVSALLRHLVQDEQPLMHGANRALKWEARFAVGCAGVVDHYASIFPSKPALFFVGDGVDPETSPRRQIHLLNLAQFLALKVAIVGGQDYRVSDLIAYGANAAGGVHHNPKKTKLKEMQDVSKFISAFGMPLFVSLLGSVARVVEKALRPIEMLILRDRAIKLTEAKHLVGAEMAWRDALELGELTYGPEHQEVAYVLHNLALNIHYQGKYSDAENLDRRSLDILRRTLGEEDAATLSSKHNLAIDLERQGRHEEAVLLLTESFQASESICGWGEATRGYLASLIRNLRVLGRNEEVVAFEDKWRAAAQPEADPTVPPAQRVP